MVDNGEIWCKFGASVMENCHNPFGNGFQPPRPYGKIPVEHLKSLRGASLRMCTWGSVLHCSVAEVKASAQMKLSLTEYFSAAASRFGQDHLLIGYPPPATTAPGSSCNAWYFEKKKTKARVSPNKRYLAIKMGGHKKYVFLITIACMSDRVSRHMEILVEWKPYTTFKG